MKKELFDHIIRLSANYSNRVTYHLNTDKRIELGDKTNRRCRFCGKQNPEVRFKQIKHAIPELIGNRTLISMYECDDCNAHFSKMENDFAAYMALYHSLAQVVGKRGVPTYKPSSQERSHITTDNSGLHIEHYEGDPELFELDSTTKTLRCKGFRSYTPAMLHKCLTKMALSIMPESEMFYFQKTVDWLKEDINRPKYKMNTLPVFFSIYPGPRPFRFPTVALFMRKENAVENVPYCLFLLAYSNFVFQTFIPLCEKDLTATNTQFTMPYILNPLDMEDQAKITLEQLDWASTIKVRKEPVSFTLGYERMEDIPITPEANTPSDISQS
ncbi:HNH endonuclease [uncultured Rikenella sp.]|uniref:HNH endonuclease n=1 Tax=uncultured Rikenella sp. TaxID=368003 RepID=UPI00272B726A|nr:HNH endonuclease [uncultured Rikenella sp.]